MRTLIVLMLAASAAFPQTGRTTPEEYNRAALADGAAARDGGYGESFCWHAAYHIKGYVAAYRAWNDTVWLDAAVRYYDLLVSKLQKGPDGYQGWIGPYMYDSSVWCDVHVGDAILIDGMVEFAEVVLADEKLKAKYGDAARRYIALARRDLFEKWDRRGTWETDGAVGAYRAWDVYADPNNLKTFRRRPEIRNSRLTLPINKQVDMAAVALKLWRITGERQFFERAQRIFLLHKSRMQLAGGAYVWNYWEPFRADDLEPGGTKARHWINVHPNRPYQAGEVAHIVEAYHTGVVFDAEDIRRILKTNLEVMWDGNKERPGFRNSNAGLPRQGPPRNDTAGTLWTSLAGFSPAVREIMQAMPGRRGPLGLVWRANYENTVLRETPSFERKYVKGEVKALVVPMHDCPGLNAAAVLGTGHGAVLMASLPVAAELEIQVDGKPAVARARRSGLVFTPFAVNTGSRVEWTVDGKLCREFIR